MLATNAFSQTPDTPLSTADFSAIPTLVQKEIAAGHIPGAVVLIGDTQHIAYHAAFGDRAVLPSREPMATDTLFDLASLTKAVATTTAVMQLVEQGKLRLDDPVAQYWPEMAAHGKSAITVRQLLTHYSGLRPDLDLRTPWSGYDEALGRIVNEKVYAAPGTRYLYSDINFEILGELVRKVSGEPLDLYCAKHIFEPLGMRDTSFTPSPENNERLAATEYVGHGVRRGEVHDPTARRMGGVAGHAGLFSTADDLAVFAQMLLAGGAYRGQQILSEASVNEMSVPQSPPGKMKWRGLGWDLAAPLTADREQLAPAGSYGHTGYTGTMLWLDPITQTYVIVLTNRVHPDGRGNAQPLRDGVIALVSKAMGPLSPEEIVTRRPALTSYYAASTPQQTSAPSPAFATGIDVLEGEGFAPLTGKRIGLITNQTGVDATGNRTSDLLQRASGGKLVALFTPEHGLRSDLDEKVASGVDPNTGMPVYSLYGDTLRPTKQMLNGVDALVFDLQDAGVRFYTYITTMAYAMEAAAQQGIDFYVLDRPNPINGAMVQGPILDPDMKSFTGYFPLPLRHGMTIGELAELFNEENHIGAKLHVIKMRGYRRDMWYDETGLPWINPSPNLRNLRQATLYPAVAMVEGANVSVGRGTEYPFELLGAPWIDSKALAGYLNAHAIAGVRFEPEDFTPNANRYHDQKCHGIRIYVEDRQSLDAGRLGVEIASALYKIYPHQFHIDDALGLIGSRKVMQAITQGSETRDIVPLWQARMDDFLKLRAKYMLY